MLFQEAPEYEQNFSMVMRVLEYAEVREEDDEYLSPLDLLFQAMERENPESVALRQYKVFKQSAGKTAKSILVSAAVRLAPFNLPQIRAITDHDDMDLYTLGEKKCALYAVIPDNDNTFNFLVSLLYSQAFQTLYYSADQIHHGALPRHVHFVLDEFAAMPLPGYTIKSGETFYRGRKGFLEIPAAIDDFNTVIAYPYYGSQIEAPPPIQTRGGRFNRDGYSYLYLTSDTIEEVQESYKQYHDYRRLLNSYNSEIEEIRENQIEHITKRQEFDDQMKFLQLKTDALSEMRPKIKMQKFNKLIEFAKDIPSLKKDAFVLRGTFLMKSGKPQTRAIEDLIEGFSSLHTVNEDSAVSKTTEYILENGLIPGTSDHDIEQLVKNIFEKRKKRLDKKHQCLVKSVAKLVAQQGS